MIFKSKMGGTAFRRQTNSVQESQSRSLSLVASNKTIVQTHKEFYAEFRKQLTDDNIDDLIGIFQMISVSLDAVSKSFFNYMSSKGFRKTFKTALASYEHSLNTKEFRLPIECLKRHSFAVLTTHIELVHNIYNSEFIQKFLQQFAMSHSFISDVKSSFKIHDLLLHRFLKVEFGSDLSKNSKISLKKYLTLINRRLLTLVEEFTPTRDFDTVKKAMEHQQMNVKSKVDELTSFTELYKNPARTPRSDYALRPSDPAYPGTSRGVPHNLDRL